MNHEALYADRIGGENFGKDTTVYKFAKIKAAKQDFIKTHQGVNVIDLGVGEHDGTAPIEVINALDNAARNPAHSGYADNGILPFQQATTRYLNEMLGTKLPEDEEAAKYVIHSIGSKGALSLLPSCFINPGDVTIMTTPGYPVLGTHSEYLGGHVHKVPLTPENNFLPDLEELSTCDPRKPNTSIQRLEGDIGKVKLFCVNYPNNPTGANATPEFWKKMVDMAHEHNFVIVHDAAYSGIEFNEEPNSPFQVDGGLECSLGLYSLSKAFNMIGFRQAAVVGSPELINAYGNVKDNSDSGQSPFIQMAGVKALNNPQFRDQIKGKYQRRLENLVDVLQNHGFDAKMPDGTFFLYTKAPTGTKSGQRFETGEDASQFMLKEQGISVVPWDDAGNFIRFSATYQAGQPSLLEGDPLAEQKVMDELSSRLGKLELTFD